AHVQAAGDVRRWNHDGVAFCIAIGTLPARFEIAFFFPDFVPTGFDCTGVERFFHGYRGLVLNSAAARQGRGAVFRGRSWGFDSGHAVNTSMWRYTAAIHGR